MKMKSLLHRPLRLAASENDVALIRLFLSAGANVNPNFLDEQGKQISRSPLVDACSNGCYEAAEELIKAGANLESKTFSGLTSLQIVSGAYGKGHADIVRLLLEHGADVDANGTWPCHTPLHLACEHNLPDIARLLLKAGARVDIENKYNQTPLDIAIQRANRSGGDMILKIFQELAPEAYFTAFCTQMTPAGGT